MKDSFILYNSFYEPLKYLTDEQLGKLLRAIFNYTSTGEITNDQDIMIAFMFVKNQIDLDSKKYDDIKQKRSEAGKKHKGNQYTKTNKMEQMEQNGTNGSDNDNDNVNDNDINNMIIIYNWEDNKQCECVTQKNELCDRRSSYNINGKNYCNQHSKPLIGKIYKNKKYFENKDLNDIFLEYLDMRKKMKLVNSDRAIKLLLNKLEPYDDNIKYKMIEQSIVRSWKSIYELQDDNKHQNQNDGEVKLKKVGEGAFIIGG